MDVGINRGGGKLYGVNAIRSPTPGLTWAAHSDPEALRRESLQAMVCLFSPRSFPSVSADSRRLGEILAAEEAKEKPRRGAMPRGLASGRGNQPHADKVRSSSRPTQRMSLALISIVFVAQLIKKQPTDIICGLRFLSFFHPPTTPSCFAFFFFFFLRVSGGM